MKYTVQITELLSRNILIDAETEQEAKQKVVDAYYNSEIVLTADDYVDDSVQIAII